MKRTILTLTAAALVSLGVAPAAQAVTNPADNPRPITVKGDDGKTYHDGEDTLPGYDDEACTYIPGAWFDFDNNRVRYADGQSIPWTEWDRATGYKDWLAKKGGTSATKPSTGSSTSPSATSKPKSSGGTTKGGTTKGGTTKQKAPASQTHVTATPPATVAEATADPAVDPAASGAKKAGKAKTSDVTAASAEQTVAADPVETTDVVEATAAKPVQDSSSAGLLILGGLGAAGLATFAGYSLLGRRRKGAAS